MRVVATVLLIGGVPWAAAMAASHSLRQQAAPAGTVERVTISGRILDYRGQPAEGAIVTIANEQPTEGHFEAATNRDGRFRLADVELTEVVTLGISSDDWHESVPAFAWSRQALTEGDFEFALSMRTVDLRGRVASTGASGADGVPGATLGAVLGDQEIFLGASDAAGNFELGGVPVALFGNAANGSVRVGLPDAWTFAGRFEPDSSVLLDVEFEAGNANTVDLGTVTFRRLENPESTVQLAGAVWRAGDSGERSPVNGLIVQLVGSGGEVAAQATTQDGAWSLNAAKGTYSFRLPNAAALGLEAPASFEWLIEFSRTDIETVLQASNR